MALQEYQRKRNFTTSPEPRPARGRGTGNRFVIQKHAASRLHYDFRLEINGVLKSWAVPKGIPFAKGEKRLAVHVEDHPVSYIDFEGTIPKGQYGGGTVMVWDHGQFATAVKSPAQELKMGKLHFSLAGKKLHGDWYLVQLRGSDQWLLIKGGASLKPVSKKRDDTSARSGKTMAQLAKSGATWESVPRATGNSFQARIQAKLSRPKAAAVKFVAPMKARLAKQPPRGKDWLYEIKFDGYRALAFKHGRDVRLLSRNEKDFGEQFPEIVTDLAALKTADAIIDGEIVALNSQGVSSFQLLQALELGEKRPPIYFYAFDLLRWNGSDWRQKPLLQRKAQLEKLLGKNAGRVRYSASLGDDARKLLPQVKKLGLEGLIGKQKASPYEADQRSGAWIKLKLHHEQEFVIGGFTNPEGSRKYFGALLLGFYEQRQLKFCGKVGTGFDEKLLRSLHQQFQPLARADCPFANLPEKRRGRFGAGITPAEMKRCHWLEPELVAQVKFSEWTQDDKLRQPVFLGLREDQTARAVGREKPE